MGAGIRLVPGGVHLTRAWIVFNKPKIPNYTHAGLLMGLGLMGEWLESRCETHSGDSGLRLPFVCCKVGLLWRLRDTSHRLQHIMPCKILCSATYRSGCDLIRELRSAVSLL